MYHVGSLLQHYVPLSKSDLSSLTDNRESHGFGNFSRLTAGRHNAHGYCKDVPQISRIVAHDCTDVNGSRTRLTALVNIITLIETFK